MELINKSALIAEIKARISGIGISQKAGLIKKRDADKEIFLFNNVLFLIDTIDVKKVDLEKEYDNEFFKDPVFNRLVNRNAGISIARHFFELGLKVQKGE